MKTTKQAKVGTVEWARRQTQLLAAEFGVRLQLRGRVEPSDPYPWAVWIECPRTSSDANEEDWDVAGAGDTPARALLEARWQLTAWNA